MVKFTTEQLPKGVRSIIFLNASKDKSFLKSILFKHEALGAHHSISIPICNTEIEMELIMQSNIQYNIFMFAS